MVARAPRECGRREDATVEETQLQLEVVIILKRRRVHAQAASARELPFFCAVLFPKRTEEEEKKMSFCCKHVAEQHRNNER